jgi:hypothetical protein
MVKTSVGEQSKLSHIRKQSSTKDELTLRTGEGKVSLRGESEKKDGMLCHATSPGAALAGAAVGLD